MTPAFCKVARKISWASEESADGQRLSLLHAQKAKDPQRLHVYRCGDCGGFHVGHARYPIAERRAS